MAPLALEPGLESRHRGGGGCARLGQILLRCAVLHSCEDLGSVVAEEVHVAAEIVDGALHEARGKWRTQVGANVRGELRDGVQITDVGAHARRERRVVAIQVDLGVELLQVPRGVGEWGLRPFEPEEVTVGHGEHDLALELFGLGQCRRIERLRFGAHGVQSRDFRGDAVGAPVGHLPVELVASCLHREVRVGAEIAFNEGRRKLGPAVGRLRGRRGGRGGRARGGRLRCGCG